MSNNTNFPEKKKNEIYNLLFRFSESYIRQDSRKEKPIYSSGGKLTSYEAICLFSPCHLEKQLRLQEDVFVEECAGPGPLKGNVVEN